MISISFNGIDPLFMYTQLFKEALSEIEDDDEKSFKELVEYCRLQGDIDEKIIDGVKREYHSHNLIWWYTAPYFVYSMLNSGLQLIDADIILKMGFFYSIFTQIYRTLTSGTTIGQDQCYSLSMGNDDHDMNILTSHLRQEPTWREGWSRFSDILIRIGDNSKAEHLYNILLDRAFTQQERRDNEEQIA
ncbi:unnamed protein product [Rotaria magnacalcarata]|uniref:Uncharacterized protein n=1 Tax=Rotaria magnacalcarata TaxID=392030 RepID=A0A819KE26_9BILA|nr:unnamed protein product [Rotaria magnacalcarata]